jgi:hypothetical protein
MMKAAFIEEVEGPVVGHRGGSFAMAGAFVQGGVADREILRPKPYTDLTRRTYRSNR